MAHRLKTTGQEGKDWHPKENVHTSQAPQEEFSLRLILCRSVVFLGMCKALPPWLRHRAAPILYMCSIETIQMRMKRTNSIKVLCGFQLLVHTVM